jgi:hypothetical protein
MIGSNIYITNRFTYGSIDPSFKAVLDLAKANNILAPLPGTVVYESLNTMIKNYKAEGVWYEWDTYFQFMYNTPIVTRNFTEFSKIDWRRLITGSYQGGLTFELGGTKGNGSNAFFNTNFIPSTQAQKYQVNNASRFIYAYTSGSLTSLDGGASGTNNNMTLTSSPNHRINTTGSLNASIVFSGAPAMKSIHRVSSTQVSGSNGGVFGAGRTTSAETLLPTQAQLIHRNAANYGDNTIGMYAMGSHLVDKVAIINTIYNQYTASIGL